MEHSFESLNASNDVTPDAVHEDYTLQHNKELFMIWSRSTKKIYLYFNYGPWLPKFLPSLFGRCPLAIVYINLEPGAISDTLSGVLAGLLNRKTKPKVFWARNRSGMKPKTFCNYFFLRVECQVFGLGRYERSFEKQTTRQRNRLKYKKYNNNNNNNNNNKLKNCLSYVLMMAL